MTEPVNEANVRVLLVLDWPGLDQDVVVTLTKLLRPRGLDLTGLYVEDEDVLRAAALPGLHEISFSGRQFTLDADRLSRDMAVEAAAARRAFNELAQGLARQHERLRHRFLVTRGRAMEELQRTAADFDFVLVARGLRASRLRARHGRHFTQMLTQPQSILFVNEPWASGSSVVVLAGDSQTLQAAARLADIEGLRLVVALPPGEDDASGHGLPDGSIQRTLTNWQEETIADLCLAEDARLLIVSATGQLDWPQLIASLMDRLPCSVLKLA
jgi:hypothetical protein